jgi:hypothetical protein
VPAVNPTSEVSDTAAIADVTYALIVVITPGDGQLSISLGGHEWVHAAVRADGLVAVPPVLLGTVYGIWKEPAGSRGLAGNRQDGHRGRA